MLDRLFLFTVVIIHYDSKTMISNLLKKDNNSKNCEESLLSSQETIGSSVAQPLLRRINRASDNLGG